MKKTIGEYVPKRIGTLIQIVQIVLYVIFFYFTFALKNFEISLYIITSLLCLKIFVIFKYFGGFGKYCRVMNDYKIEEIKSFFRVKNTMTRNGLINGFPPFLHSRMGTGKKIC